MLSLNTGNTIGYHVSRDNSEVVLSYTITHRDGSPEEVKCVPGWYNYGEDDLNPAGLFDMECNGTGGWSFRARNGKYLCVDQGDQIKASRDNIGSRETFQIELLSEPTLQDQINAAKQGDTISLKEGLYGGTVDIDKSITITGAGTGKTVIDGDRKGSVFTTGAFNPDIEVRLEGIVIRGGLNGHGGAIFNKGRLALEDVVVSGNETTYSGGGLYNIANKGSIPPGKIAGMVNIKNSRIVGNKAAHQGGGVINFDAGAVTIDNSCIEGNVAAYGGGVLNHLGTSNLNKVDIVNNRAVVRSRTEPKGEGGGVWTFGPSYKRVDCNIKDNRPNQDQEYIKPYPPTMRLANNLSNESVSSLDVGDAWYPKALDGKGVNVELAGKGERFGLRAIGLLPWKNDPAPGV